MSRPPYRIFAGDLPVGSGPSRPTTLEATTGADVDLRVVPEPRDPLETELLRILDAPADPGASLQRTFDRKEQELFAFLVSLDSESRSAFVARISAAASDDELTPRFARFTHERRTRILTAIARAGRRRTS